MKRKQYLNKYAHCYKYGDAEELEAEKSPGQTRQEYNTTSLPSKSLQNNNFIDLERKKERQLN